MPGETPRVYICDGGLVLVLVLVLGLVVVVLLWVVLGLAALCPGGLRAVCRG